MTSQKIVIQICDDELRLLGGVWPDVSVQSSCVRDPGENLGEALQRLTGAVDLKTRECVLVLPRREAVFRVLELPSADEQETGRMVALQIPALIPFEASQAVCRHRILRTRESGYSDVLVMIILNSALEQYLNAADRVGLTVRNVFVSFDGLAGYVGDFCSGEFSEQSGGRALVICDEHRSELMIFDHASPVFSYYIASGRRDAREDPEGFCEALRTKLMDYHRQGRGQAVKAVYFPREFPCLRPVGECFQRLEGPAVRAVDLFADVPAEVKAFAQRVPSPESWIAGLGCLGSASRERFSSFLPERIRRAHQRRIWYGAFGRLAVTAALALFLSIGLFWSLLSRQEAALKSVRRQTDALEPQLAALADRERFLDLMASRSDPRSSVPEIIKEVYEIFPEGAFMRYFAMRPGGSFEIQGSALEDDGVSRLQSALVSSARFTNVDLKFATKRKRFNQDYTEFKMTFDLAE